MITLDPDNLLKALACISGSSPVAPSIIKEAESALLTWENTNPSSFAIHLLQILTATTATPFVDNGAAVQVPRLAAALTAKAMIGRKWKDRGRLSKKAPLNLIDNETKNHIRHTLLSLISTGGLTLGQHNNFVGDHYSNGRHVSICMDIVRDKALMTVISSILAKIAILDIPLEFKELLPTLIGYSIGSYQPIDTSVSVETRLNTANAVEFILAELCLKRLLIFRKYIISIASTHLSNIVNHGLRYSMDHLNRANATHLPITLQYAIIMTKISHHLILSSLSSLKSDDENNIVDAKKAIDHVFELALEYMPLLCKYLSDDNTNKHSVDADGIEGYIKTLLAEFYSLIVAAQKAHPISFSRFLNPFLTLFYTELEKNALLKKKGEFIESMLVIPQITFLANVISCSQYEPDENSNEAIETWRSTLLNQNNRAITIHGDVSIDLDSVNKGVHTVWTQFLTSERINSLVELSLFYMNLNESHLTEWKDDSETFFIQRKDAITDDDIISCAQVLYLSMLESKCKHIVLEKLSSIVLNGHEQIIKVAYFEGGDPNSNESYSNVVFWDAVYTSVGLSIGALKRGYIDIDKWFASSLSKVMKVIIEPRQNKVHRIPILRQKIIWLLGCAAPHLNDSQLVFDMLVSVVINELSDAQNDAAVQLTAIEALIAITSDPPDNFLLLLRQPDRVIASLYTLTNNFQESSSKSDCLLLIQQLLTIFMFSGQTIEKETIMQTIVRPLEQIWNSSTDQYLMIRRSVVSILGCVASFGPNYASNLHPIALPLLNTALDPQCDENAFLIADALDLWLILLRLSSSYDSNFGIMFRRVEELLQQDLEHVRKLMLITEGYILLGGQTYWDNHASSLGSIVNLLVGNLSQRGIKYLNLVFEALLKKFPAEGSSMVISSGVITTILKSFAARCSNEKDCEPFTVIHIYLTVISRVVLALPNKMDLLLHHVSTAADRFDLSQLVDLYFQEFNEADPFRQKLWTMAVFSFLLSPLVGNKMKDRVLIAENINQLLRCCLTVISEDQALVLPYSIGYDSDEEALSLQQDQYNFVLNSVSKKDVVYTINFRLFYLNMMNELQRQASQNLFSLIDQNLVKQIQHIM